MLKNSNKDSFVNEFTIHIMLTYFYEFHHILWKSHDSEPFDQEADIDFLIFLFYGLFACFYIIDEYLFWYLMDLESKLQPVSTL